jgi:hypothetical protein
MSETDETKQAIRGYCSDLNLCYLTTQPHMPHLIT